MNESRIAFVFRAWIGLALYDCTNRLLGRRDVGSYLTPAKMHRWPVDDTLIRQVCESVDLAACFYVKRVFCLQRSIVIVRLLRESGVDALLVIGYRPTPFLMHAWVEVDGRAVGEALAYHDRLTVLRKL